MSVVSAVPQPPSTGPTAASGSRCTSSQKTSLNSASPVMGVDNGAEVALLLPRGPVGDDRRPDHPDADRVEDPRNASRFDLLVDDHLLERPPPLAAVLRRPGRAGVAGLGQLALPGPVG